MSAPQDRRLQLPDDLAARLKATWLAEGRTYVSEADVEGNVFFSDLRTGEVIDADEARSRPR